MKSLIRNIFTLIARFFLLSYFLIISEVAFATNFTETDSKNFCETKPSNLEPSYRHCREGDLVEVDAYEVKGVCKSNSMITELRNKEYICVYRGSKRTVRERPLTKAEKEWEEFHSQQLMEKYLEK